MAIEEGNFISITYTGECEGKVFDTTDQEVAKEAGFFLESERYGPLTICVGKGHLLQGFDRDVIGKEEGYTGEVTFPPELGFGPHDPSKVKSFPKSAFKKKPVKGGLITSPDLGEGVVVNVVGGRALVDFNQMYAGKTITYRYSIETVATDPLVQLNGLISFYAGNDIPVTLDGGVATIEVPTLSNRNPKWERWHTRIINEAFHFIPAIEDLVLIERYRRDDYLALQARATKG